MKNKNRYYRNRNFRIKYWKRIRNQEHPFRTYFPYMFGEFWDRFSYENQIKENFRLISQNARALESGRRGWFNAPANYRKHLNDKRKAQERAALRKINSGDYEVEVPEFRNNANWLYF